MGWAGISNDRVGKNVFSFLWSCMLKVILSCSFNARPTPVLGSHHFFFMKMKGKNMEDKLKKKDTEEVVKCSTNSHTVPELPKPLQVFFALMITMLSLSIFCSHPSLQERLSFFTAFSLFLVVGWGGVTPKWSACSFSKAGPITREYHRPYTEQPSLIPPRICCAPPCACARYRGCLDRHFKTRALVWNVAQFVKNVKEEKNTFKAHLLVSTFPTFALYWLFWMNYFLLLWPF